MSDKSEQEDKPKMPSGSWRQSVMTETTPVMKAGSKKRACLPENFSGDVSQAADATMSKPPNPIDPQFGLKILIVGLGVLLLVAVITFFILLFTVGIKDDKGAPPASVTTEFLQQTPGNLSLAPGEEITHMALDEGELALHLTGPEGQRILLVNPYTADHKAVINITQRSNSGN